MRFAGQGVLVAGGSRGIGRAVVVRAAREGARVVCCGRSATAPELFAQLPEPLHDQVRYVSADVGDEDAVEGLFDGALEFLPRLDAVVGCAGTRTPGLLVNLELAQWNDVLRTNVRGAFLVTRRAVEEMMLQDGGGRIVHVGSVAGEGFVGEAPYAASKAALLGLSRSVAKEYGPRGIACNAVVVGFTRTEFIGDFDDATLAAAARLSPLARIATAEEVAEAILFLASRDASYITGTTLRVSGGVSDVPYNFAARVRS